PGQYRASRLGRHPDDFEQERVREAASGSAESDRDGRGRGARATQSAARALGRPDRRQQCGGVPRIRRVPLCHGNPARRGCRTDSEGVNMGRVSGKVALVTGAARGIGRAQAVRLAEEGADIVAFDICAPVDTVIIPPATPEDLAETARAVEAAGAKVVTATVDVRDGAALRAATDDAVARLGGLDIVCATAGITSSAPALELSEA